MHVYLGVARPSRFGGRYRVLSVYTWICIHLIMIVAICDNIAHTPNPGIRLIFDLPPKRDGRATPLILGSKHSLWFAHIGLCSVLLTNSPGHVWTIQDARLSALCIHAHSGHHVHYIARRSAHVMVLWSCGSKAEPLLANSVPVDDIITYTMCYHLAC